MEHSMNNNFKEENFINEGIRLVDAAEKKGVPVRLMGAIAVRIHCPHNRSLLKDMSRPVTDIDLMAYKRDRSNIKKLFEEEGYHEENPWFYGGSRSIFTKTEKLHADVFYDKLVMCHSIDFSDRLELDYPTITISDILLEKMQIIQINEKDLKDTLLLFKEHDIEENTDKEAFNATYIAQLLSKEWGFYYTVTINLEKVQNYVEKQDFLQKKDKEKINTKIQNLMNTINQTPKSTKWKIRAKIGTKQKWYSDVEEVVR
jgi:hypothetical protein